MSDWIAFIKSIPGAAKALTELIGDLGHLGSSVAKFGVAKMEKPRRAVEDQTESDAALSKAARESDVAITKAIAAATVKYVAANAQQIGERALSHSIHRFIKQQENREAVAIKTIENLRLDPPNPPSIETPSDDWLNLFGRYAENASSEKMREHWSHILEGEIRKPGRFSFITLQLASILDARLAGVIERVRPWICDGSWIPLWEEHEYEVRYVDLVTLAGIGFLHMGNHAAKLEKLPGDVAEIELIEGKIRIPKLSERPDALLPIVVLTTAGKELISIVQPSHQPDALPKLLLEYFAREGISDATYVPNRPINRSI
jgi:hypothetical protein